MFVLAEKDLAACLGTYTVNLSSEEGLGVDALVAVVFGSDALGLCGRLGGSEPG